MAGMGRDGPKPMGLALDARLPVCGTLAHVRHYSPRSRFSGVGFRSASLYLWREEVKVSDNKPRSYGIDATSGVHPKLPDALSVLS